MGATTAVGLRQTVDHRTVTGQTDDCLVAQVRAGDDAAFETIYDRYARGVLAFCVHMLGSREAAEDALQLTFVSAYRALRGADGDISLRPWLYTIARNRCLSELRARREAVDIDGPGVDRPCLDGVADQVQRREELREILADMQRLPPDQRAALALFELGDQSHNQIAAVLGVRKDKVKALIFQAREALVRGRQARNHPCAEIRERLATLPGRVMPRSVTRAHIDRCPSCAAFEGEVRRQRAALALILPVALTGELKASVLGSAFRGGGAVAAGTGACGGGAVLAAGTVAAGGASGAGAVTAGAGAAGLAGAGTGAVSTAVVAGAPVSAIATGITAAGAASVGLGGVGATGVVAKILAAAAIAAGVAGASQPIRDMAPPSPGRTAVAWIPMTNPTIVATSAIPGASTPAAETTPAITTSGANTATTSPPAAETAAPTTPGAANATTLPAASAGVMPSAGSGTSSTTPDATASAGQSTSSTAPDATASAGATTLPATSAGVTPSAGESTSSTAPDATASAGATTLPAASAGVTTNAGGTTGSTAPDATASAANLGTETLAAATSSLANTATSATPDAALSASNIDATAPPSGPSTTPPPADAPATTDPTLVPTGAPATLDAVAPTPPPAGGVG
jgi:RNA polymerase sigma factor (sigma-70 family)